MALFMSMAKLRMTHVPLKAPAPALVDMLAGQIEVMTGTHDHRHPSEGWAFARAGCYEPKRAALRPSFHDRGSGLPGYEAVQWYGLLADRAHREIIAKLNEAVARATQDAAIRKRFLDDGVEPVGSTPEEFAALIRSDMAKWATVVKDANIKAE
jgi:tripartite-type tricarboxylate transporter receptor subunit TctC